MESPSVPTEKKSALLKAVKQGTRTALVTTAISLVVVIGGFMIFENKLIYFPTKGGVGPSPGRDVDKLLYFPTKDGVQPSPGQDVELTAADGVKLHGWYYPHPQAKATILHLHGNAGNLEDRRDLVRDLQALGVNVLAIDWRGYGKSEGKPSEEGLYKDARAAWDWLLTKTTADKIVIHGESLGGGPACELASTVPCAGLILQSTFTSIPDMAPRVVPIFPKFLVRTKYDNLSKVPKISCRKLFLHSQADEMIPFDMGQKLYDAASDPKECTWFTGVGHNEMTISRAKKYYSRIAAFLEPFGK